MKKIVIASPSRWIAVAFLAVMLTYNSTRAVREIGLGRVPIAIQVILWCVNIAGLIAMVALAGKRCVIVGDQCVMGRKKLKTSNARAGVDPSEPGAYIPWRVFVLSESGEDVMLPRTFMGKSVSEPPYAALDMVYRVQQSILTVGPSLGCPQSGVNT